MPRTLPRARREALAATVRDYLDALGEGDPEQIASFVTEDFENEHSSALGTSVHGRAAYRERLPHFLHRFRRLRYEVEDLVVEGDRVVAAYRMTFVHHADDGARHPVALRGVFRFRLDGDRIAHRVDYWDGVAFQRQLEGPGLAGDDEVGS